MASGVQNPMANGDATTLAPSGDDKWDEARYEASLKHLHDLHLQLRRLRATIPRMIAPATDGVARPADFFPALQQSMRSGAQDVKDFKEAMASEQTNKIMSRAAQSRKRNPLQIKPWRPKDDPNWCKMDLD